MEIKEIPGILKQLRMKYNLTQEELAAKIGVAFSTLNRWENGRSIPRSKAVQAITMLIDEELDSIEPVEDHHKKQRKLKSDLLATKSMEQMLWSAACSIRGEKDAPKFKDYILPLVFIKRLSDVFEDEVERLTETYGDYETALSIIEEDPSLVRFYIPPEARWAVVSGREQFDWTKNKKPKTLGEQLTTTMRIIVKANSSDRDRKSVV